MQPTNIHADPATSSSTGSGHNAARFTAASFAPSASSSSSSSQAGAPDAYDEQDVSSILPPSRRSSLSTRRSSAVDSSLAWWGQQRRPSLQPRSEHVEEGSAGNSTTTTTTSTAATPVPFALWQFHTAEDTKEDAPRDGGAGLVNPFKDSDAPPLRTAADTTQSFHSTQQTAPTDVADRAEDSDFQGSRHPATVPFSPPFAVREDASKPAPLFAVVSAPPPEDSMVRALRGPATTIAAAAAPAAPAAQAQTNAATPPSPPPLSTTEEDGGAHVHFSSEVDVIEAASHASTSTMATTGPTERRGAADMYEIDVSDESSENGGAAAANSFGSGTHARAAATRSPPSHGLLHGIVHVPVTHTPLPVVLSPDELQLERLRAYDDASRQSTESQLGDAEHHHQQRHDDDRSDRESNIGDTAHLDGDTDGEFNHTQRRGGATVSSNSSAATAANDNPDDGVSTLDFLRETANTILPDAFTSMFATTTNFFKAKTDAVVSAVPQPLRRAMTRTGEGIATVADVTGAMLSNVGVYAMRGVPDRVLSPEWKYLIFVDAVNVLKCSLNVNILVAPYIFRMAGLVGGVLLILSMQVVCCYYTEVYFRAKNEMKSADHVIMYGDVPRLTFGRWYPTFQLWYDGIALVATVAYAALNMQALLPHMNIKGDAAKALSFIIPSLFCLPFAFLKRARTQPPMMTLASLLIFISLVMMFTVFPYGDVVSETLGSIEGNAAVLHLFPTTAQEFFVALGICVYVLTPLSRAVPVERTMRPARYVTLLRVSAVISTVVYIAFGVCAIVSYGSHTCSVLSTSFDNNNTAVEVAVMALLFFAFLFYIPLHMFELGELCDRRVLGWRAIPRYGETGPNVLRILFLVGSALVAWCIPYYGLLIALSGCLGYSVVAIIVPAALDYVCRARYGLLRGHTPRFLDYVIAFCGVVLGAMTCVVGVVMTTYEMWLVVQSGYSTTC